MQVREIPNRIRAHFPARNSANRVLCVLPRFPLVEFTSDLFSRTLVNRCDESSLCSRVQHLHLDACRPDACVTSHRRSLNNAERQGGERKSVSESGSGSKGRSMGFWHEKLDVYRAAIEYVGWAYCYCECLKGHRHAKDRLPRASQSIPLNI